MYFCIFIIFKQLNKILFTPWKLGLIEKSKYEFGAANDTFDSYLSQSIVLLNYDFNCSSSFALSRVDKATIRS